MLGTQGPLVAVIVTLLAAGLGVPIPEDLSLLTAGYLVWSGQTTFWLAIPLCWLAIVIGDSILWWLGHRYGNRITQHRFLRRRLTPRRLERIERHFEKHGAKTILVGRFAAGARAFFFLAAGAMNVSYAKFLFFDGLAAAISGTTWILIGWRFGAQIDRLRHAVVRVEHMAALVLLVCLGAWLITRFLRRRVAGPPDDDGQAISSDQSAVR
jgi:membrane protein DedA with SNARE-associated domain